MSRKLYLCGVAMVLATAIGCGSGDKSPNPVSPAAGGSIDAGDAGANGETLKVTAPTPLAPANGSTLNTFTPNLQVTASSAKFQGSGAITHRFQLLNGSTVVREATTAGPSWVPNDLQNKTTYGWRCRGEQGNLFGPWSATWTFTTPDQPEAYMRPGEMYDPLIYGPGRTVGRVAGPVTFIPGVGARLESFESHIRYELPQTVASGEFSVLVTGILDNSEGGKTKLMSMSEGAADITTNDRRFTLERRGNPFGVVAWRFISHLDQVDTGPHERRYVRFTPDRSYLITVSWRGGRITITMHEDGAGGRQIYGMSKAYQGAYDPSPHFAYLGTPVSRRSGALTVPGMIVRQAWLSSSPRPSFANR